MNRPTPLAEVQVSLTFKRLTEEVAEIVGYSVAKAYYCMECGDKVGEGSLMNHARWHLGLPPKPKHRDKDQPAKPGGSE